MSEDIAPPPGYTGDAEYDGLAVRFRELIGDVDERTTQVLAAHFTVERELEITLNHFLAHPEKLGTLKFGHKVQLLRSCCPDSYVEVFLEPALRLDNLRNALAHNNKAQIAGCFTGFVGSLDQFVKAGVEPTAEGVVRAAKILTQGLTFVRVENFAYSEVRTIVAAHVAKGIAAQKEAAGS
jgi:hypothetical protein